MSSLLYSLILVLLATSNGDASNFNEPHSHNGKLSPFTPGDPKITLDPMALQALNTGKPYKTQIQSGSTGRGLVIQDIHAPTDVVWDCILNFNQYANMVPKMLASNNYRVIDVTPSKVDPLSQIIYTRMKVGVSVLTFDFFVKHLFYPSLHSLTWTLDYEKRSDLEDSCGFWYVIPRPEHSLEWTRVYYSVQISMYDWVPKFAVDFMSVKTLTDATGWVKKFSELEYQTIGYIPAKVNEELDPVVTEKLWRNNTIFNFLGKKRQEVKTRMKAVRKNNTFFNFLGKKRLEAKARVDAVRRIAKEEETNKLAAQEATNTIVFMTWARAGLSCVIVALFVYNSYLYLT